VPVTDDDNVEVWLEKMEDEGDDMSSFGWSNFLLRMMDTWQLFIGLI